jgi:G3E family GTPase
VNKTDLAGEQQILQTIHRVESLNPRAVIFRTKNAVIEEPVPNLTSGSRRIPATGQQFHFDTLSFKLKIGAELASLIQLFEDLAMEKYGNVVRAKALVQTDRGPYRFDVSRGKVNSAPFEKDIEDSRIVIIGTGLDHEAVRSVLN